MKFEPDYVSQRELPIEAPITSSRRIISTILIFTIFGFIVVNLLFKSLIARFPRDITKSYQTIQELKEPVDVIILGDSTAYRGVLPSVIKQDTSLEALNLATVARWGYLGDMYVLQWYIEKFGPPPYVIVAHTYNISISDTDPVQLLLDSQIPLSDWNSPYAQIPITWQDNAYNTLVENFPTIFRNISAQQWITGVFFEGKTEPEQYPYGTDVHYDHVTDDDLELFVKFLEWDLNVYSGEFSDFTRTGIESLLQLLDEYQIPTYVTITPILREVSQLENFFEFTEFQQVYWSDVAQDRPYLHFNPEIVTFDKELMYDTRHVHVDGAEIYTLYLADWIWGDYIPATLEEFLASK